MIFYNFSYAEALELVSERRPIADPNRGFKLQLKKLDEILKMSRNENKEFDIENLLNLTIPDEVFNDPEEKYKILQSIEQNVKQNKKVIYNSAKVEEFPQETFWIWDKPDIYTNIIYYT